MPRHSHHERNSEPGGEAVDPSLFTVVRRPDLAIVLATAYLDSGISFAP